MGFVLGLGLSVVVGLGLRFGSGIFSRDMNVQHLIYVGIPVRIFPSSPLQIQFEFAVNNLPFLGSSVCCSYTTHKLSGFRIRRRKLWSTRFCIFCILHGKLVRHLLSETHTQTYIHTYIYTYIYNLDPAAGCGFDSEHRVSAPTL